MSKTNEEIVEEFNKKWNTPDEDDGFMRDDRKGVLLYKAIDWLRTTLEEVRREERERIFNKLSSQELHAEAIHATLGAGHHYSTMPVVAGIVSRLKEALTPTTTDKTTEV